MTCKVAEPCCDVYFYHTGVDTWDWHVFDGDTEIGDPRGELNFQSSMGPCSPESWRALDLYL